jgi:hypothetical protein
MAKISMDSTVDKLRWAILDAVSDDYEPMEMIVSSVETQVPGSNHRQVQDEVDRLLIESQLCTVGKTDISYGMTLKGCETWERLCGGFSDGPPNWVEYWTIDLDYQAGTGYVSAPSREACESALAKYTRPGITIDRASYVHAAIAEFQAKYYKRILGGHRIDFTFTIEAA